MADSVTLADLERSRHETTEHIRKVRARLAEAIENLVQRGQQHDQSKLREPELHGYAALQTRLAGVPYGTDEYRAALKAIKPTIAHHYAENDHHPEHYPNGVADMSLLALLEMICDWKAASERGQQTGSLRVDAARFGLDPQLASILQATIAELGW